MMLQFIPYPLIFCMIFLIAFDLFLVFRKSSIYYIFFSSLFWIYLCLVAGLTLFPIPIRFSSETGFSRQPALFILSHINLIPFDYSQFASLEPVVVILRQVVDNILLTMPFGFLIHFITRAKVRKIPLWALAAGISIEFAQLMLCLIIRSDYRGIDINDALMNMLGVLCGYGCFWLFSRWFSAFTRRFQVVHKGLFAYVSAVVERQDPKET